MSRVNYCTFMKKHVYTLVVTRCRRIQSVILYSMRGYKGVDEFETATPLNKLIEKRTDKMVLVCLKTIFKTVKSTIIVKTNFFPSCG